MKKLLMSLSLLSFFVSSAYCQTYVYDKNLKVSEQLLNELSKVLSVKIYSSDEIISEFMANEIRAEKLFKNDEGFIIKGRITRIFKIGDKMQSTCVALQVGDDESAKRYLHINTLDIKDKKIKFDNIENYSVGDWINIYSMGYMKYPYLSYEYLFFGSIFHTNDLVSKRNHLVKITNIPKDVAISFDADKSERVDKFTDVLNGKSYCRFLNIGLFTTINVKFSKPDGTIIKNAKLKAKINCHSIFDYNKL